MNYHVNYTVRLPDGVPSEDIVKVVLVSAESLSEIESKLKASLAKGETMTINSIVTTEIQTI